MKRALSKFQMKPPSPIPKNNLLTVNDHNSIKQNPEQLKVSKRLIEMGTLVDELSRRDIKKQSSISSDDEPNDFDLHIKSLEYSSGGQKSSPRKLENPSFFKQKFQEDQKKEKHFQ